MSFKNFASVVKYLELRLKLVELKDNKEAWKAYKTILGKCKGRESGEGIELCTIASFDYFKDFDNVLDLFGGSGSTMIACEKKNKNCCLCPRINFCT